MPARIKVFISYAPEDDAARQELEEHLSMLQQSGAISVLHRKHISPGQDYNAEIARLLDQSGVVLLLVSKSYLASEHCVAEMQRVLGRHQQRLCYVIPLILHHCDWQGAEFEHLTVLPDEGKPVTHSSWGTRERAWTHVVLRLRDTIEALQRGGSPSSPGFVRSFVSPGKGGAARASNPVISHRSVASAGETGSPAPRPAPGSSRFQIFAALILFCVLVAGATWLLDAIRSSSAAGANAAQTARPPPARPAQQAACPAPCCGGIDCAAADQDTADTACAKARDHCAACTSGRICVSNACSTPLAPRRKLEIRLARVDMPGLDPGAEVCVKKTGAPGWAAKCTAVADAADLPGVMLANGMRTRLSVTTADIIAPNGIDIEIRVRGTPIAAQAGAVLKGNNVLTSALCIGVFFEVGPGRVIFYIDD